MAQGTNWHEQGEEPDYRFSLANERTCFPCERHRNEALTTGAKPSSKYDV
jgi:hypothetical protein